MARSRLGFLGAPSRRRAVAAAAAAALLGLTGLPAQADFYSFSGAVGGYPVDPFPTLDVTNAVFDATGITLSIGGGGTGSFSALAGAQLTADTLSAGDGLGTGTITIDGSGTTALLVGTGNRLQPGNWGTGTLVVSGGALLDATANASACTAPGAYCNNFIGNAAGSTGTLTITGSGSELRALRYFGVGSAAVFTLATSPYEFGTAGAETHAYLNVLDGATLRTDGASISNGPNGSAPTGSEHTFADVVIDGAGSHWIVSPDRFNGGGAYVSVANHPNAEATISVTGGGKLSLLAGSQSTDGSGFNLGNGGKATMTISGLGSEVSVAGLHGNFGVGTQTGGDGLLTVESGGQLSAGNLFIGRVGASGVVVVDGGTILLNGSDGRLLVGDAGTGSLTVKGGGLVDATLDPANCVGNWCGNGVANRAGSTGTLEISGAGSEVRTLRSFWVADVYVDQYGGTPGGISTGTVKVLAGGSLRTENAYLGTGLTGPGNLGTEKSVANVLIDGPGSQWIVTRSVVDNGGTAFMSVGGHANATANVTVSSGGLLRIDGSGGAGPNSGIHIGSSGKGTLVLTDTGSKLQTAGLGAFINVGANNSAGDGSFQILAGATAESLFFNVGRNGGKGDFVIDGAGSQLTLSGVNTDAGSPGNAGASIGRNGGIGTATVRNGGRFLITDGGQDSRPVNGNPSLNVGRDASGNGSLTVTGPGSTVEIVSTSLALAAGVPDNYNPFVTIGGRGNSASTTGTLMVKDGGKLILTGNAVSTVADPRGTSLHIGGRSLPASGTCTDCVGTGTATVTGLGSEIIVQGYDAYIGVGRNADSNGTLNVLDQGKVSSISLVAGHDATGTINVNNGSIALSGYRTDSSAVGAGVTIGRGANGVGTLNLANGSSLTIDADVLTGGMSVGGDQFYAGGTGTVTLTGGSSIVMGGPLAGGAIYVGRNGVGTMNLSGASLVDVGNTREFSLATEAGGSGNLSVSGTSKVMGNVINIGGRSDTVAGGVGTATVSGLGSEILASGANGFVGVGRSAIGTLTVANQGKVAAIAMSVGRSAGGVGTLSVNNGTLEFSGQQTGGNLVGAGLGIGLGGGSGSATITNNSVVTMTNLDTAGAYLVVGGSTIYPLGSGALNVSGGSQIKLTAAPGLARVHIGHDGNGVANFSGASLLDVGDGSVYVAQQPGSTGTLTLSGGSTLNAGFVGVGVSQPSLVNGNSVTQYAGGNGHLVLNNSTINTTTFELGLGSTLSGDGGTINASGNVIIGGILAPGNSPGSLAINCNLITLPGSALVLDVLDTGSGFSIDHLIIGNDASFNLASLHIVFNFLGTTNPEVAAAALDGLNLDNFLRSATPGSSDSVGLSTQFATGQTWTDVVNPGAITAQSSYYDVTELHLQADGGFVVTAVPVPEPSTWGLMALGLVAVGALARRRERAARRV